MGTVWKSLLSRLTSRRAKARRVPIADRFAHFRAIGAANDVFLDNLTSLMEGKTRGAASGLSAVKDAYESLSAPAGALVRSLVAMAGGRYGTLLTSYEAIDRELSQEVLKARPIEFGSAVMWPDHPEARRPQVVGPKAARLAEIGAMSLGLEVPPFFTVTAYGFRYFMEATGLQDLAEESLWSANLKDAQALAQFSQTMRQAVLSASVPPRLGDEIRAGFRHLREVQPALSGVAVRSSAVVEDSDSSFAGQFESLLNVGEDGLLDAYRQVIASKYRLEALQYAMARGFLDEDVGMPVLIMAMVRPAAAGVAYSYDPFHPGRSVVTAVRGLAQPMVEGRLVPDRYWVSTTEPPRVVALVTGDRASTVHCQVGGGLVEVAPDTHRTKDPVLSADAACRVAQTARTLERAFRVPQDVEWAIDEAGTLFIVQARPLGTVNAGEGAADELPRVEGYRVLVRDAMRASGGVASGRILRLAEPAADAVPEDAVLLVPHTSPRLAGMVGRVRAILAAAGSPTGHMATVAREFGVPCLVGVDPALPGLEDGSLVTVDARAGIVYEGEVPELRSVASPKPATARRDPVAEGLERLLAKAAPLTLTDPDSPDFRPANCQTLHDIARFVHQRAMAEMFELDGLSARERRQTHRLAWRMPMDVLLLDLGGGLASAAGRLVPADQVASVPLLALLEGMTDPRLRWAGPVGFDLKGFVSVVVRSAADDQRYGEPSYALFSRDYLHFSSRLAYHFATVDAICGRSVNENYARFLFHGGAAVAARREFRAHFLASVLRANGFATKILGDRVEALLSKRRAEAVEESLVMLGRLMVASRHLDMVMESRATAEAFAQAFLSGDFGFELVRGR